MKSSGRGFSVYYADIQDILKKNRGDLYYENKKSGFYSRFTCDIFMC